jgi:Polyketide cyclase / dehydrase and lipid transport
VKFTITRLFHAPAQRVFDFTNDDNNFTSFTGYGPIPGITRARYETPGPPRLGAIRRIEKTDGTEHREEITLFQPPTRHTSRITGLTPPFSWLVREASDDWIFRAEGKALTVVERTFSFELTTPLAAPVAWLILQLFMKKAIARDMNHINERLSPLRL